MPENFNAKILSNSVSSLKAQQAQIGVTANNIANVNTPGYSRRSLQLETRMSRGTSSSINIGNGVDIGNISRSSDAYIESILREAAGDRQSADVEKTYLTRIGELFDLSGKGESIGTALTAFFTSINDLAANPSSIELRTNMLQKGNDLTEMISTTFNSLASMQEEIDQRLGTEVQAVNALTSQIAELNGVIKSREGGGATANDERDKRELLLQELSEKITFSKIDVSDGTVNISLEGGFTLVNGTTARAIAAEPSPSFDVITAPSLSGKQLSYIVYNYSSVAGVSSHIDFTSSLASGSGTIGGLLRLRGVQTPNDTEAFEAKGTLIDVAARVESIAKNLLFKFNQVYSAEGLGDGYTPPPPAINIFDSQAGDLNGNRASAYGFFGLNVSGGLDRNFNNLVDDESDLKSFVPGFSSFAKLLKVSITDPRAIAAAIDQDSSNAGTAFPSGNSENLKHLSDLQSTVVNNSVGSFSFTGTFNESYSELVSFVGNTSATVNTRASVAESNYLSAQSKRDAESAVSLDEEFTNLIKFQKAFTASAKMIKVADDLLTQIVQLL